MGNADVVKLVGDWNWGYLDEPKVKLVNDLADGWHKLEDTYPLIHLIVTDRLFCEENRTPVESVLQTLRDSCDDKYDDILTTLRSESGDGQEGMEQLQRISKIASSPVTLGEEVKVNVRAWMEYAVESDVLSESSE